MKINVMNYEQIIAGFEYEDGTRSFTWRENGYKGSLAYENDKTIWSISTAGRCYVLEIDVTPDRSPENASWWIDRLFRSFMTTRKAHKSMKSFVKSVVPHTAIAFYSSDNRNRKNIREYNING